MLVTLSLLLVSCNVELTPEEEAEVKAELEALSDEELVDVATGENTDAIAGQGYAFARYSRRSMSHVARNVLNDRLANPQQPIDIDAERMANTRTTQGPDVTGQIDTTGGSLGDGSEKLDEPCTCDVDALLSRFPGLYSSVRGDLMCGWPVTFYELMDCRDPNHPDEESIAVKKSFVYTCDEGKLAKVGENVVNECTGDHYEVPLGDGSEVEAEGTAPADASIDAPAPAEEAE